jgi:hypothetical protein
MLGLDVDQDGTNSGMTHGTVLSVEVRRNERLTWVVVADSRHW